MFMQRGMWTSLVLALSGSLAAQIGGDGSDGVFHPTSDVVIDTSTRPGGYHYKSITIPAGVTVGLIGTNPAIIRSQGSVDIAGTLHANGYRGSVPTGGAPGAGGYAGGDGGSPGGKWGQGPGGGAGGLALFGTLSSAGQPGKHRTVYGAALPFDLRGGSGAGGSANSVSSGRGPGYGGSGGGGTIVLLADNSVNVTGKISANGEFSAAGGSIMVRSLKQLRVSGAIDAQGGGFWMLKGGDGFVRLDAYGDSPVITGTVLPAPTTLQMPALREATPLTIGTTWRLEANAVPADSVLFYASLNQINVPLPPLGILRIDPSLMFFLGVTTVPVLGHDPVATLSLAIPNAPGLRGLWVHVQSINPGTKAALGPKLSNHVSAQVK